MSIPALQAGIILSVKGGHDSDYQNLCNAYPDYGRPRSRRTGFVINPSHGKLDCGTAQAAYYIHDRYYPASVRSGDSSGQERRGGECVEYFSEREDGNCHEAHDRLPYEEQEQKVACQNQAFSDELSLIFLKSLVIRAVHVTTTMQFVLDIDPKSTEPRSA